VASAAGTGAPSTTHAFPPVAVSRCAVLALAPAGSPPTAAGAPPPPPAHTRGRAAARTGALPPPPTAPPSPGTRPPPGNAPPDPPPPHAQEAELDALCRAPAHRRDYRKPLSLPESATPAVAIDVPHLQQQRPVPIQTEIRREQRRVRRQRLQRLARPAPHGLEA